MITRGSKFFFAAAAVGLVTALLYGFVTGAAAHGGVIDVFSNGGLVNSIIGPLSFGWKGWVGDQLGYGILMGFTAAMAVMGGFTSVFRDGSPEALAQLQGATVMEGQVTGADVDMQVVAPQGLSYWPLVGAFSAGAAIVGLAVSPTLFVIGCIGAVVVAVEWTVKAWSERATGDPVVNSGIRARLMHPIEVPVAATLGIGVIILSMARILLAVSKVGAVFVIIGIAVCVFGAAVLISSRPELKRSVLVAALLIGGALIIGGGIAGGVAGTRESEHHSDEESLSVHSPAPTRSIGAGEPAAGY